MALDQSVRDQMSDIMTRYPEARSAVMPMLHLAQSVEDEITPEAMRVIADMLGLTAAEVTAVATFYTMYKRRPVGKHHIGVCTNTLCAMLGGDAVYAALSERLGIGHNERDVDGTFWLERIECQAACTHAPVMTVDWEFMDCQTPTSALDVIDRLSRGEEVVSTRGPVIRDFQATEHTLAFPVDGLAGFGGEADAIMRAGLTVAKERGMSAPAGPEESG
ncbi:MAG: NAD(P)H-dependent oxidoreductase subunit E [Candidatus Nanopelagicales bacterium]|jgi:NADH-quinone oxidoreductase subunit E|nr:NAD(P)H-dependent oxidoreductase subunit E [Candidatus Nanopelagicales bacterium]MDP4715202.1 NAD(P)H-dependent oxidoreductase subunit E [Candidatus Nanopelagicales bacterium]MDP4906831.1 NAD(P)H-dependent oxidoreductase subunit E [Candidatus Nanopelagicales bacterium]MDP4974336.1 NAD(P)H-dependent oxidoreductase subunit E [Candidatus Nanopelagicales bacterium]MDP5095157.1 NAD(P)H-dependent oxidoreductase subunit E [Candidatus Nanopelagicales bacterium]